MGGIQNQPQAPLPAEPHDRVELAGIAAEPDLLDFFARLPNKDKQFVALSGIAHNPMMGVARHKFYHALGAFLALRF